MTSPINGYLGTFPVTNPVFLGGYVYSRAQAAGVAAANNFLSLTNPAASGRTVVVSGVFISSVIVGDIAATVDPMRGYLATAVTGTTEAVATIGKIRSTMPNPVGEIRLAPAGTLGAAWFNSPPVLGVAKQASPFVHSIPSVIPAGALTLLPGESTIIRAESGDTDQRWNVSIAWGEF